MSFVDKARTVRDDAVGKAKQVTGELTGDEQLEEAGRREQNQAGTPEPDEPEEESRGPVRTSAKPLPGPNRS
jgi:hypothetical protein